MTIGALTVGAGVIAVTVASGGAAPVVAGAIIGAAEATAVATGAVTATTAAVAATATSTAVGATAAGGWFSTAFYAGLSGATVGGPVGAFIACFKEDTKVETKDGFKTVAELKVGEEIKSLISLEDTECSFSKVTDATTLEGAFSAHEMIFSNGTAVTVTSPHYMIVCKEAGKAEMVAAIDVRVGDHMRLDDGTFARVVSIKDVQLDRKVNIEVDSGLMYVNGVLATGVCELGPRKAFSAGEFLAGYRATHSSPNQQLVNVY